MTTRLDQAISAAETELRNAQALPEGTDEEKRTKATKVAAASASVNTLKAQKASWQQDIDDAVQNRLPDANTSAQEQERARVAGILGIPKDQLTDDKLAEVKQAWHGTLNSQQQLETRATTAESNAQAEKERADKQERIAKAARDQLATSLIEGAVRQELLSEGVVHEVGEGKVSYLEPALREALRVGTPKVTIDIKDDGTLEVKGDVTGAKEAAAEAKKQIPAFFGKAGATRETGSTQRGDTTTVRSDGAPAYKPNYSTPPGAVKAN